ncbi:tripartite tricarboxylate transporter substrate-binding protein, partial [Acinetobacter baumannii]
TWYPLTWVTRALLLLVPCGLHSIPAAAEYPDRQIKLLVPFTAGGPTDALARTLAEGMKARMGQPVIVDNRSGAGGNIAADF